MFKRIATSTLIVGAVMSIMPALASAEEFRGERERGRVEYRDRDAYRDRREFRDRDDRFRDRDDRFRDRDFRFRDREYARGFYDRFGCWHWY